jgi:hypothetical protein
MRSWTGRFALLLAAQAGCIRPALPADRYLYEVSCSAKVEKFDAITQRKVDSYDLATRTGNPPLIPTAEGPLETCLANGTVFDRNASVFYTLVPSEKGPADAAMDYRILGFSIPAVSLVMQMPAGTRLEHAPHIEVQPGAHPQVLQQLEWKPKTEEDLSTFAPAHKAIANRILETSADRALVRLFEGEGGLTLGVADSATKKLVRLQGPLATTPEHVHLAPGATHVLVEDVAGAGPKATKTGTLRLYDAATGLALKAFSDPHVAKLYFLGISPGGKVLYGLLDDYWFLDLGVTFPPATVQPAAKDDFPAPVVFSADR